MPARYFDKALRKQFFQSKSETHIEKYPMSHFILASCTPVHSVVVAKWQFVSQLETTVIARVIFVHGPFLQKKMK